MIKDDIEILARLLAAEEHPHLRDDPEYLTAEKALSASPELEKKFAESKAFMQAHPVLIRMDGMPADSRARIEKVLRDEMKREPEGKRVELTPWGMRKNFAWAAVLALLLAGMALVSSTIIEQNERREKNLATNRTLSPREAFYAFAGELAEGRMPLQHRENGSMQLVSWLEQQGAQPFVPPRELLGNDTMGCAYLDGPNGKVSLICFNSAEGTVHLFVTTAGSLKLSGVSSPQKAMVNHREALKWHDQENAYLLITHDKDQKLPEMFL